MAASSDEIDQLPENQLRFIEFREPALEAGDYELTIHQEIKIKNKPEQTITNKKRFAVRGERFQLAEEHIHACFPPENATGRYSNCMPHIVLKNEYLPWMRQAKSNDRRSPWLVLLVFDEAELYRIRTDTIKISELNRPLETGEDGDDKCRVLEVPQELLKELLPGKKDLQWLSHVRQVSNERKEDSYVGPTSDYSVIIGNRMIPLVGDGEDGKKHAVHLVSIEGYYDDDNHANWYRPGEDRPVQLVSLKQWEFVSVGGGVSFMHAMKAITPKVFGSHKQTDEPVLQNILSGGYCLLRHQMRQGDKTVSLYRGPLVPCHIQSGIELPIAWADAAVRFYADLGIFDVSYAAAWQLGRLLALQNTDVSRTLIRWKRQLKRKTLIEAQRGEVEQELGSIPVLRHEDSEASDESERLAEISDWLGQLKNLSGLPFQYLVPDAENMLPDNSIRFFYIDRDWTRCLIDGACSIGRTISADLIQDEGQMQVVDAHAEQSARQLRRKQPGSKNVANEQRSDGAITGFLLRSEVITHWPGLEIEAYSSPSNSPRHRLALINMNKPSSNVLMCLFDGEIQRVDIYQPGEGIHYGVDASDGGITLRDPRTGRVSDKVVKIKFRQESKESIGVIDVASLAGEIRAQFGIDKKSFTAAQFGLAMISGAERVNFNIKK